MKAVFDNLIHLEHANIVKFHKYWADTKENRARVSLRPAETLTESLKIRDIGLLLHLFSVSSYFISKIIIFHNDENEISIHVTSSPSGDFHY